MSNNQQAHPVTKALNSMAESCVTHAVISGIAGMGAGVGMGVFFGTFEGAHGDLKGQTTSEQVKYGMKKSFQLSYERSKHLSKSFGAVGLVYAFLECNLSKYRAKTDIYNAIFSGAGAGALFGVVGLHGNLKFREQTTLHLVRRSTVGALGFAVFSGGIEYLIQNVLYNKRERSPSEVIERF